MILPQVHGNYPQHNFYLYTACDTKYFEEFGAVLVNSVKSQCDVPVHVHLFNPTSQQLETLSNTNNVSITYEYVDASSFAAAAQRFDPIPTTDPLLDQYKRTQSAMTKGHDQSLVDRMQKTYYACARFVRLANMYQPNSAVLAIDVDAVVRRPVNQLEPNCDFYIHRVLGKKARFLAGGIHLNPNTNSQQFIQAYSHELQNHLIKDCIYWGLDQDVLENIASQYHCHQLPTTLIDWEMRSDSVIWTAKGTRKSLPVFVNESAKYKT